jgi:hypothetical protein
VANASACTGTFLDSSGAYTGYSGNFTNNTGTFAADSGLFKGHSGNFVCTITFGRTQTFVVTGNIPIGSPVITNNDGTVQVIDYVVIEEEIIETTTIVGSVPIGPENVYNSANQSLWNVLEFDPHNPDKFVMAYSDSSTLHGSVIVGTISAGTITFGYQYEFTEVPPSEMSIAFDPVIEGQFILAHTGGVAAGIPGNFLVGNIDGTAVTFSEYYSYTSENAYYPSISFDPSNNGKFVVAYRDGDDGKIIVGTMSGSVPSFGTPAVFNTNEASFLVVKFDPSDTGTFVINYIAKSSSLYHGMLTAGSLAGTTPLLGAGIVYDSNSRNYGGRVTLFDPNHANKFMIAFSSLNASGYSKLQVCTLLGNSTSLGDKQSFSADSTYDIYGAFHPTDSETGNIVLAYTNASASHTLAMSTYTVTNDVLSAVSEFIEGYWSFKYIAFDPNNPGKFVYVYNTALSGIEGAAAVGQLDTTIVTVTPAVEETNLTEDNFTGIAEGSYSDGQTGNIITKNGIAFNLTGLVQGTTYYVLADGSISDVPDMWNVVIGIGLSSTSLLLT